MLPLIYVPMHPLFTTPISLLQDRIQLCLTYKTVTASSLVSLLSLREILGHSPTAAKQIF